MPEPLVDRITLLVIGGCTVAGRIELLGCVPILAGPAGRNT